MQVHSASCHLPQFVVFEGVDGSGKTTLASALAAYYRSLQPQRQLYANAFPGTTPGTLGEWVYRFHHRRTYDAPDVTTITPAALQLLHVAAHIEAILTHITPTLLNAGCVILDRYWWSTYSYARLALPTHLVWPLVNVERAFLASLPQPNIVYLTRHTSLKAHELSKKTHKRLDQYYTELIDHEQQANQQICVLTNDLPIEHTWSNLLALLKLPPTPWPA